MKATEFLEKNVFTDLKKINEGSDKETIYHFSESDFETVLQRVEHFGIGMYQIETWLNGEVFGIATHTDLKKKATDAGWFKKAFKTFKASQTNLTYSATYKVSNKLLARKSITSISENKVS